MATLAACGGTEPPADPPLITSFAASLEEAPVGTAVTLTWSTRHATTVAISGPDGALDLTGESADGGSVTVQPGVEGSHTYTLTATGAEGTTPDTAEVSFSLTAAIPAPSVLTFTATPNEIAAGEQATLSWSTAEGTQVDIVTAEGTLVFSTSDAVTNGSTVVTPEADEVYTLTVSGPGGADSADAAITVLHPPLIDRFVALDLTGEPVLGALTPGSTVRLEWDTTHAASVILTDASGTELAVSGVDGSVAVTPAFTSVYTLRAVGPDGEASSTVEVQIIATVGQFTIAALEQEAGGEVVVRAGEEITLAWQTSGAAGLTITGPAGWSYAAPPEAISAGTTSFTATTGGPVTLALDPAGPASEATVMVELTEAPRVRSMTATPDPVTAGEPVEVTWVAEGSLLTTLKATDGGEGAISLTIDDTPEAGAATLSLPHAGEWTITAVAMNHSGTPHERSTVVTAVAPAVIGSFHVRPTRVIQGDSATITWETTGAEVVRLVSTLDGVETPAVVEAVGSRDVTITQDISFHLEAENTLGTVVRTDPVPTLVGAPEILTFQTDNGFYQAGDPVTFTWETRGGRSLEVVELVPGADPVVHCSITDSALIESGTCQIAAPAASPDAYSYQLRLMDGATEILRDASILVIDGPVIRSLTASRLLVTAGNLVTFTAHVTDDAAGATPALSFSVTGTGLTTPEPLPAPVFDANVGAYVTSYQLDDAGEFTFQLEASTTDTAPSSASVTIQVVDPPEILAFESDVGVLDSVAGPTSATLSWSTNAVASLSLYAGEALLRTVTDPVETSTGSLVVAPDASTTYRVVAYNTAGSQVVASVLVQIDVAGIVSFVATGPQLSSADHAGHLDILDGETSELTWSAARADYTLLSLDEVSYTEEDGFRDLTQDPDAVTLFQQEPGDPLREDLSFRVEIPEAYRPTFYAGPVFAMTVHSDGWLDTGNGTVHVAHEHLQSRGRGTFSGVQVPASAIHWATGADVHGRYVLVQWTSWHHLDALDASLTFEAFLYADGTVRFAYGPMLALVDADEDPIAEGDRISIGLRAPWGTDDPSGGEEASPTLTSALIRKFAEMPGGLAGRGWRAHFVKRPAEGKQAFTPEDENTTLYLLAHNVNGQDMAQVDIETWPDLAAQAPKNYWFREPAQMGDPVPGFFNVRNARHGEVRVADQVFCETDAWRNLETHCVWEAPAPGTYDLVLHYRNPVSSGSTVFPLEVLPRMEIVSFTVNDSDAVSLREPSEVTLAWDTLNADVLLVVDQYGRTLIENLPPTGTAVLPIVQTTELTLYAADSPDFSGRVRTVQVPVYVNDTYIESVTASATTSPAGAPVTIDWDVASSQVEAKVSFSPPLSGRLTGQAFESLVGDPAAQVLDPVRSSVNTVDLSAMGFRFPFGEEDFQVFQLFSNGWIGFGELSLSDLADFDDDYPYVSSGYPYGGSSVLRPKAPGFLAVFWDTLHPQPTADGAPTPTQWLWKVSGRPGERSLVVEWSDWTLGTTTYWAGSINVQAVLHENGDMEIRYGPVAQDPAGDSNAADDYRGSNAVVGWGLPDGSQEAILVELAESPEVIGEGIFHYFPRPSALLSGSTTLHLADDVDADVCVTAPGYSECQHLLVDVIRPGDIAITELMVAPAAVGDGEYVELRNTTRGPIDVSGWTLEDADGARTTLPAMTPIGEGAYVVLAASDDPALNGGIAPQASWAGSGLDLDDDLDALVLRYDGIEMDSVAWDASGDWTIPVDASLTLGLREIGPEANDVPTAWCTADAAFSYAGGALLGSPGAPGMGCDAGPYAVDTLSTAGFIDISGFGLHLPEVEVDEGLIQVPGGLGFTMPYWGQPVSDLWVSSNGWVWLGPGVYDTAETNPINYNLPNDLLDRSPDGVIAPFWDSLTPKVEEPRTDSAVYLATLGAPGDRVTIVQWHEFDYDSSSAHGAMTFQVQLYETGDLAFSYGRLEPFPECSSSYLAYYLGDSATIGIESPDNLDAIVIGYGDPVVFEGLSLVFRARP